MHIKVKHQTRDKRAATLCVDREARSSIVLNAEPEDSHTLATLAKAAGAGETLMIVSLDEVDEYLPHGWMVSGKYVVLRRDNEG